MKHTRKRELPKGIRTLIITIPGASTQIARRASCSKALVSRVLSGRRSCSDRLWDEIVQWISEQRMKPLVDMATVETKQR